MADGSLDIKRGEEAQYLISHPLMVEAFGKVRDGVVNAMTSAPMGDEKTHNRLVIALQLLNQIERQLKDVVTTGKLTVLQTEETLAQKVRRFAR